MSGILHIDRPSPAWLRMLRAVLVLAPLGAFAWYAWTDEGLPMAAPTPARQAGMRATPLPAPPAHVARADTADDDADAREAPTRGPGARGADEEPDFATRNAAVDPRRLTATRPLAARAFLSEVLLAPGGDGAAGFVVAEVLPESRFDRMGLKPGDLLYTLDTPRMAAVDENSMMALVAQSELELQVYRQGTLTQLHTDLARHPEPADAGPR
jgi:hypothetical protein